MSSPTTNPESAPSGESDAEDLQSFSTISDEDLHREATERLARSVRRDESASFPRQMLQLVLIPAIIVAGIMGVWMLVIVLGGQSQKLDSVLQRLESVPAGSSGSILNRPGQQERGRAAVTLMSWLKEGTADGDDVSEADRQMLRERLPRIARLYLGSDDPLLVQYIMEALGVLADTATLDIFVKGLNSELESDQLAAVAGLAMWRGNVTQLRALVPDIVNVLRTSTDPRARSLAAVLLGGAADPDDRLTRDALARALDDADAAARDVAWNAGCALAALGDERGLPVIELLLDRAELAARPQDPTLIDSPDMNEGALDKLIATVINVVVTWDPQAGKHIVRIHDPGVWSQIEFLAEADPSDNVRTLAKSALVVYRLESPGSEEAERRSDPAGTGDEGGGR